MSDDEQSGFMGGQTDFFGFDSEEIERTRVRCKDDLINIIKDIVNTRVDQLSKETKADITELKRETNEINLSIGVINTRLDDMITTFNKNSDEQTKRIKEILNRNRDEIHEDRLAVESSKEQTAKHDRDIDRIKDRMSQTHTSILDLTEEANLTKETFLHLETLITRNKTLIDEMQTTQKAKQTVEAETKVQTLHPAQTFTNRTGNNAELYLIEFDCEGDIHPMHFLKFTKRFVEIYEDTWETKFLMILKRLKGQCKAWAGQHIGEWNDFDQFEKAFKRRYWGMIQQKAFENKLIGNGDFKPGRTNLINYVLEFYNTSQYLDNKIEITTFLSLISQHLPRSIAATIATAQNIHTSEDLENLIIQVGNLRELEDRPNTNKDTRQENFDRPQAYRPHYRDNRRHNNAAYEVRTTQTRENTDRPEQNNNQTKGPKEFREQENNQTNREQHYQENNYRGNNFRNEGYKGNNYRGNNDRGNNYRGNNYRGNNFRNEGFRENGYQGNNYRQGPKEFYQSGRRGGYNQD